MLTPHENPASLQRAIPLLCRAKASTQNECGGSDKPDTEVNPIGLKAHVAALRLRPPPSARNTYQAVRPTRVWETCVRAACFQQPSSVTVSRQVQACVQLAQVQPSPERNTVVELMSVIAFPLTQMHLKKQAPTSNSDLGAPSSLFSDFPDITSVISSKDIVTMSTICPGPTCLPQTSTSSKECETGPTAPDTVSDTFGYESQERDEETLGFGRGC